MASTVIDHAIAIPATQDRVWNVLSDLSRNPIWQADSESVSFLTTMQNGRGTRLRNRSASGREYVVEISAWYDGLGYEYQIVDGVPVKNCRGRIRLQEAAEGTIVQWTLSYEVGGVLQGLRNNLSLKRNFDYDIVDSLRNLYSYIKSLAPDEEFDINNVKSMMRDAPDVEIRAQYQSRYTSDVDAPSIDATLDTSEDRFKPPADMQQTAAPIIPEPPLSDEDTKPNPAITFQEASPESEEPTTDEPGFVKDLPQFQQTEFASSLQVEAATSPAPPEPALSSPMTQVEPETDTTPDEASQSEPEQAVERTQSEQAVAQSLSTDERDVGKLDTAQISVFEVFGLQKPSHSEQVRAIREEDLLPTPVEEQQEKRTQQVSESISITPDVLPDDSEIRRQRIGLRVRLRNHRVNVRRPG